MASHFTTFTIAYPIITLSEYFRTWFKSGWTRTCHWRLVFFFLREIFFDQTEWICTSSPLVFSIGKNTCCFFCSTAFQSFQMKSQRFYSTKILSPMKLKFQMSTFLCICNGIHQAYISNLHMLVKMDIIDKYLEQIWPFFQLKSPHFLKNRAKILLVLSCYR